MLCNVQYFKKLNRRKVLNIFDDYVSKRMLLIIIIDILLGCDVLKGTCGVLR